jgi:hypothetical protein
MERNGDHGKSGSPTAMAFQAQRLNGLDGFGMSNKRGDQRCRVEIMRVSQAAEKPFSYADRL